MTSKLKGGKTPPRLLYDLKLYNPDKLPISQHNVLTDLPLPYSAGAKPKKTVGKGSCKHSWALKPNQCSKSSVGGLIEPSVGEAAAFCTLCRIHLKLRIVCQTQDATFKPCPQPDSPLHHFVYQPKLSSGLRNRIPSDPYDWADGREFICTARACSARLSVHMYSPRLTTKWVNLLVDKTLIEWRAKIAIANDPERFEGHAIPSAVTVLTNLRQYIENALKGDRRRITKTNKKWLLSLGEPCSDLLSYLGFSKAEDGWCPPESTVEVPYKEELDVKLDDVEKELIVLLEIHSETISRVKGYVPPVSAIKEFQELLACKTYATNPGSRTVDLTEEDEHPWFAGLGAILDFHDGLISFSYDQQLLSDPENSPYYLECLQGIAAGRKSEDLQTKAAIEASSGKVSLEDCRQAYQYLGLDIEGMLSDELIIGTFQSRAADSPKQEPELRRSLKVIGQHRNSTRIETHASDTISTYEQALDWLGASKEMDDSFIVAMHDLKVHGNPANKQTARDCVGKISETRNSQQLKAWMKTGVLQESEMDPAQAYIRLNIEDSKVEDDLVLNAYKLAIEDTPSQVDDLTKALRAIAKERNSSMLLGVIDSKNGARNNDHSLSEWPVGLENIGNTCYLNSLLQFYFSIKPLRDLVLNFDDYRMVIEPRALAAKKVGSRNVTKGEVNRAQQFVYELKILFGNMITANRNEITPERQLARLTLVSSIVDDRITRRYSTLSATRPDLEDINKEPTHGHASANGIVNDESARIATTALAALSSNAPGNDDASSQDTLVETNKVESSATENAMVADSVEKDQQAQFLEDKENLAPSKAELGTVASPDTPLDPLADTSPSRVNKQRSLSPTKDDTGDNDTAGSLPSPPSRPPPVPPRNNADTEKAIIQETEDYARQQDVTEVIGNVLFQLQCAIRAKSIDDNGEQIDEIKELFFGKQNVITTDAKGKSRTKEEVFSDLKINVESGPQDIYAAIDASLDKEMVTVGTSTEPQYRLISKLPPILQIYPNRTAYDIVKKAPFKVNHHLDFKDVIYMDRYMDSNDPDLKRRRDQCWEWKEELRKIEARQTRLQKTPFDMDVSKTLAMTANWLKTNAALSGGKDALLGPEVVSDRLIKSVEQTARDATAELATLSERATELRASINAQFSSLQQIPYRLHSVFIHRGMVSSGHYWIYIYDFAAKIWRKYNDGHVTEVHDPASEIFATEPGDRPATPMFIVYVKDGLQETLVEAVNREPKDKSPAGSIAEGEMEDVQMGDATVLANYNSEKWSYFRSLTGDNDNSSDVIEIQPPRSLKEGEIWSKSKDERVLW